MRIVLLFFIFEVHTSIGAHFGYTRMEQLRWQLGHSSCGGLMQSPIFINGSEAVELGMPALETIGYRNLFRDPATLTNNGHSVALSFKKTKDNYVDFDDDMPYIIGGLLDHKYQFEGLHFHWGGRNNRGSEHILNDVRYPLEMHLVHRNKKYHSVEKALKHKDGLAVLAVLFQLTDKDNDDFKELLKYIPAVLKYNTSVEINSDLKLQSLMPSDIDRFYTYKGSLTTPPCSEVVTWFVFPETKHISFSQVAQFRDVKTKDQNLVDNYRMLQAPGKRRIFVRNQNMKHSLYFSEANFLKWNWFN